MLEVALDAARSLLGLRSQPFPNPLTPAAGCTVVDLEGQTHWARTLADLPPLARLADEGIGLVAI